MNIINTHECYGCGVCTLACPKNIISLRLNTDGFYEPYIPYLDACIDCGLCVEVCAYNKIDLSSNSSPIKSYAGWSLDSEVRKSCSSGGVGFEIAKALFERDYKVIGVRYNIEKHRAEHFISNTYDDLMSTRGSKYLQSYTGDVFKLINRKDKYLFIGTPCQVDSLRHYIKKFRLEKNFVLVDFFCHGVPSYLMWYKYLSSIEDKIDSINQVFWRDKKWGWYDSWVMKVEGTKIDNLSHDTIPKNVVLESKATTGDNFYRCFLGNVCLGNACYDKCKYKAQKSSADIRLGDMWGSVFRNNKEGVSGVVSFTKLGDEILKTSNVRLIDYSIEQVMEGQMHSLPFRPIIYEKVRKILHDENSTMNDISPIVSSYLRKKKILRVLKNPSLVIKRILKRF